MATTANIQQTVSPADALWALIQTQKKSVQRALVKKINDALKAEKSSKSKMTEEEFYAKLDKSIASTASGPVYTMNNSESGMDFINRMLSN